MQQADKFRGNYVIIFYVLISFRGCRGWYDSLFLHVLLFLSPPDRVCLNSWTMSGSVAILMAYWWTMGWWVWGAGLQMHLRLVQLGHAAKLFIRCSIGPSCLLAHPGARRAGLTCPCGPIMGLLGLWGGGCVWGEGWDPGGPWKKSKKGVISLLG